MKDYYKTLGVEKKASKEEIKKAFYKLAHQHHPDKNKGNDVKFKEINEAYQTLSDDKKRASYDQFGSSGPAGGGNSGNYSYQGQGNPFGGFDFSGFGGGGEGFEFDMGDIFDMFGGGRTNQKARSRRGDDLQILVEVSLSESFAGANKKVIYNRHAKCETCKGNGAKPGTQLKECKKCAGKGIVNSTKRTIFGNFAQESVCTDCEGVGKIPEVKCPECKGEGIKMKKEEITVPVKEGVENGQQFVMRGLGEAVANGESGDLYVTIRIAKNKPLTKKARELLEELKKEGF